MTLPEAAMTSGLGGWNGPASLAAYVAMGVGIPLTIWAWLGHRDFYRQRPHSSDEGEAPAA